MSPWRIFSQKGLRTGISSSPQKQGLSILGSQATDPEQLKKDFGCCCKEFSGCGLCDNTDPDGVDSFTVSGALFANQCLLNWTVIPFGGCGPYYGEIVKTGRYPTASEEFSEAIYHTFDGMAIKEGYVVCLYFRPNFNRTSDEDKIPEPDMIFKGPKVINNTRRYSIFFQCPDSAPLPLFHSTAYTGNWHSIFRNPSIIVCRLPNTTTEVEQYGFERADYTSGGPYRTIEVYTPSNPLVE